MSTDPETTITQAQLAALEADRWHRAAVVPSGEGDIVLLRRDGEERLVTVVDKSKTRVCPECNGRQWVFRPGPWKMYEPVTRKCGTCGGKGSVPADWCGVVPVYPAPAEAQAAVPGERLLGVLRRLWCLALETIVAVLLALLVEWIHSRWESPVERLPLVVALFLFAMPSFDKSRKP